MCVYNMCCSNRASVCVHCDTLRSFCVQIWLFFSMQCRIMCWCTLELDLGCGFACCPSQILFVLHLPNTSSAQSKCSSPTFWPARLTTRWRVEILLVLSNQTTLGFSMFLFKRPQSKTYTGFLKKCFAASMWQYLQRLKDFKELKGLYKLSLFANIAIGEAGFNCQFSHWQTANQQSSFFFFKNVHEKCLK